MTGGTTSPGVPAWEQTPALRTYTPAHLAAQIPLSKTALEGERKQVTVRFADLKGSMESLADRDPAETLPLAEGFIQGKALGLVPVRGLAAPIELEGR